MDYILFINDIKTASSTKPNTGTATAAGGIKIGVYKKAGNVCEEWIINFSSGGVKYYLVSIFN